MLSSVQFLRKAGTTKMTECEHRAGEGRPGVGHEGAVLAYSPPQ